MRQSVHTTRHALPHTYDIYLVGVGGQGVLTTAELITQAAIRSGIPANFYPTKGMAQRGGSVKAQIRLGRQEVGPNIPVKGADLVIAMEVSEALKAVRFVKPGRDFVLFGQVWLPTAVMLGNKPYPSVDQVLKQVQGAGATVHFLPSESLPLYEDTRVPANVFALGAAVGHTALGEMLHTSQVVETIRTRWAKGVQRNVFAFQAGLEASIEGL